MPQKSSPSSFRNRLIGAIGILSLAGSFAIAANGVTAAPARAPINDSSSVVCAAASAGEHTSTGVSTWTGNATRSTIR